MKKLILATFLFLIFAFTNVKAQDYETFFTVGDTTETYSVPGSANYMFIMICDSSVAGTDSIIVTCKQGITRFFNAPVGVHDLNETSQTTNLAGSLLIPGNNVTRIYSIDLRLIPRTAIEIRRANVVSNGTPYAPKTRLVVTFQ